MYHAQVLDDLLDIQLLCAATGKKLACAELLAQKVRAMAQFLRGVLHPDGEIPLFNDSALGGARAPAELLALAESPDFQRAPNDSLVTVFPETGYAVMRNPASRSTLIFDCGPLGPDYQPGHGHCDVLSYELSLHGQRVVVDTGTSTYEAGPERCYERSTAAHNTARIDEEEQAEIWASFRVGRRPHPRPIRGGECADCLFVSGEHDAYRRLGVVHARTVLWHAPDTWVVVDHFGGRGEHRIESFLHFHPQVRVEPLGGGMESVAGLPVRRWSVELAHQPYVLATFGSGQFELGKSWYAERFGDRQTSTTLHWIREDDMPTGMIHLFTPAGAALPRLAADWRGKSIEIDGRRIPL
jgi:uncharacterized heparinase superfamily protein